MEIDICNIKCEPELEIFDIIEICEDGEKNTELLVDSDKIDKPETVLPEKPFKCDVCEVAFTRKWSLTMHKKLHFKEKSFICDICNRAFSIANTLKDHRYLHSDERLFKCDVCEKTFKNPANLRHHKRTHSDKRYNCDICEATYTRHTALKSHKLVHSGDLPFDCSICDRKFRERRYLRDHKCAGKSIKEEKFKNEEGNGNQLEEGAVDVCN